MVITLNKTIPIFIRYIQEKFTKKHLDLNTIKDNYILRVISLKTRETRDIKFETMTEISMYGYENRHDANNLYFLVKKDGITQKEHIIKLNSND